MYIILLRRFQGPCPRTYMLDLRACRWVFPFQIRLMMYILASLILKCYSTVWTVMGIIYVNGETLTMYEKHN